ncbi:MAG: DEAD/DEAH box helicase [Bacteroidetes bacterium]|nr:DEAD/DEAH box helicase [Bacteroidota bacterium]
MQFQDLGLNEQLVQNLLNEGYVQPTPIQQQAIPHVLKRSDVFGMAQTGTGKTAAFALPLIQLVSGESPQHPSHRKPVILVLAPTRELASQINESFIVYGKGVGLRTAVIFGGVSQKPQEEALRRGVDVLVATPGRLLDLMNQGLLKLDTIRYLVLDEVDRMLDMGFIHDIRRILPKLPAQRQTLFFSATAPDEIIKLSSALLRNPVHVRVAAVSAPAETVQQSFFYIPKADKPKLLLHLLSTEVHERVLVFSRTKHGSDRIARVLTRAGITAAAIHGDKSQGARERALDGFKKSTVRVLVATDIAARGIDIDELTWVINYDLPEVAETYVHRIGRTGRAGTNGKAISFCSDEEKDYLTDIRKLVGKEKIALRPTPEVGGVDVPSAKPAAKHAWAQGRDRKAPRFGKKPGSNSGNGQSNGGNRNRISRNDASSPQSQQQPRAQKPQQHGESNPGKKRSRNRNRNKFRKPAVV